MDERAEVVWKGGLRYEGDVRGHRVTVDKPEEKGGTDAGPMPTEQYLVALASCTMMATVRVADKREVPVDGLRGVAEMAFDGGRAERIRLTLHIESGADPKEWATVARLAGRACTVEQMTATPIDKRVVVDDGEPIEVEAAD